MRATASGHGGRGGAMADTREFVLPDQPPDFEQILREAQERWLLPTEIYHLLSKYNLFRIAPKPPHMPPSGSLFLFDRNFGKDGHNWRKEKDGKTVKKAHEILKIDGIDVIHCYYAHGKENENFERRTYSLLEEDITHIVLIHYLDDAKASLRRSAEEWSLGQECEPLGSAEKRRKLLPQTMELNILQRVLAGSEEPRHLDLLLLRSITENFSEHKKIGVGGCGEVYKGTLQNGDIAVKRLFNVRTIKNKMFHREVKSLITTRHQNIVRFLGYCSFTEEHALPLQGGIIMVDIRERLLCFEYISNGNLANHLTDELRGLEWCTRYEIIVGICKGLLYLHKEKDIVHMDLKPANILLDDLMVPKITDFGLSRLNNNSQEATTSRLMSPGYCAPEYVFEGKSSSKSDIYSLGAIVTELVTGSKKEPNVTKVLRRWRHRWIKTSKHTPWGYQQVTKCLELAQRCMQIDPIARPDIVEITHELNTMDSKDGQFQKIPCLDDMLGIEPLEIHFPVELDPQMSHLIELTNYTDDYIGFMTMETLRHFCIEPNKGIVLPQSKCSVTVKMQAQVNVLPNNHHKEEIMVLSTRVDGGLATTDITEDMFTEEEGAVVDEVNVMVVFDEPQLADDES